LACTWPCPCKRSSGCCASRGVRRFSRKTNELMQPPAHE
jgi:hypothetical protein